MIDRNRTTVAASRFGRGPSRFLLSLWLFLSPLFLHGAAGTARAAITPLISATKADAFLDLNADGKVDPGETIVYTIIISNKGSVSATNVVLSDTVDSNTTIVPGSPLPVAGISGDTLTWSVGTIPAGQSATISFQVTVDDPFTGGTQVSNQGFVTADGGIAILTDDPAAGGANDPTVTLVNTFNIFARDGKVPEPPSGTSSLLFTVALSTPAPTTVTVNFATASGTATGGVSCGGSVDYISATGTVTFAAGEQVRTVPVDICADASADSGETLSLNLSGASSGNILDNQATGTITAAEPAGTTLITELRTFGPGGSNDSNDDFVEIYNNTSTSVTVAASDASSGWGVYSAATCNSAPLLLGTIPNGTVIPPRGHYLLTGTAYSLANYGGTGAAAGDLTMVSDLPSNGNVAIFSTSDITNLSTTTRLDAVGFGSNTGGAICDLLREGTTVPAATSNLTALGQYTYLRDSPSGVLQDTSSSAADFIFLDPNGVYAGAGQRLGAAGPENLASPLRRDTTGMGLVLLDGTVSAAADPNRVRSFTSDPANNSTFGTLSIRRRFVNNTGASVTRLRVRAVDISTFPTSGTTADLRMRTSSAVSSVSVNDSSTCAATGTPTTAPCTVTVQGTTLETPPSQPNGGGVNATLAAVTVSTGTPLAAGASLNVHFLLGIQQSGNFRFLIIIEALP